MLTSLRPPAAANNRSLVPLLAVVFIGTLGFSIVLPFLVFLILRFGGNATVYGFVGATYSFFQLIGAPLLGRWSDRYGRRKILLLSQGGTLFSWCLFLVALLIPLGVIAEVDLRVVGSFTLTVPLLLVFAARALDGLTGGNISVAYAYLADITTEKQRSAGYGKMSVAQNLGFIAGPALAGLLAGTNLGEKAPVLAAVAISAIALALISWWLPESRCSDWQEDPEQRSLGKLLGQENRDCHEAPQRLGILRVFAMQGVALILAIQFLVYLAFNFFYVAFPVYAASDLQWSLQRVGLFLSYLSALMVIVQGPVLSWLSKRMADRALAWGGGLLLAVSFLFFRYQTLPPLMFGAALLAAGNGVMWPSLLSLLSKSAGPSQGSVQGVSGGLGAIASIAGLLIGGIFYGYVGSSVFYLSGLVALLAWLSSLRIVRASESRAVSA